MEQEFRKLHLSEFKYFTGSHDVTLNIADICTVKNEIAIAVTDEGKITVRKFELKKDGKRLYFKFGPMLNKIDLDDFTQVEN